MGAGEHRRGAGGRGGRRRLSRGRPSRGLGRAPPGREPSPLPAVRPDATGPGPLAPRTGLPPGPAASHPSGSPTEAGPGRPEESHPPDPDGTRATKRPFAVSPVWKRENRRGPGDPANVTEPELIQRLKDGDQDAARSLYDAHVERVFRICYRFAGEDHLAQDFTQETFVRAFTKIETFRGDSAFGTWLGSIATTVSLNGLRKVKRFRGRETVLHDDLRASGGPRGVEPDVKARLHRAIDELPTGYRTVFLLHDLEGYTHEEIGAMLGIKAGTSKSQLFRARTRLREALADHAGEWAC